MDLNKMKRNKCALESMTEYLLCRQDDCEEYDAGYTQDEVNECGEVLDEYIDTLIALGDEADDKSIMRCVQRVVQKLNQLNERCDYQLIETDQREEMVPYIIQAAEQAGLSLHRAEYDITEEWREW